MDDASRLASSLGTRRPWLTVVVTTNKAATRQGLWRAPIGSYLTIYFNYLSLSDWNRPVHTGLKFRRNAWHKSFLPSFFPVHNFQTWNINMDSVCKQIHTYIWIRLVASSYWFAFTPSKKGTCPVHTTSEKDTALKASHTKHQTKWSFLHLWIHSNLHVILPHKIQFSSQQYLNPELIFWRAFLPDS